jgi:hypothetical protein
VSVETEKNFDSFTDLWKAELPQTIAELDAHRSSYLQSYARIASLNAWKANVLEDSISVGSLEFFTEAINDALISHIWARVGSWRSALMSLRGCIENTFYSVYYKDHSVEMRLWESGKHRPAFSEIHNYLRIHPDIGGLGSSPVTGLAAIKNEYATLSRAVHASAKNFRMSPNMKDVTFWTSDAVSLNQWRTRERQTLAALNLLLTSMFRGLLQGTQRRGLRHALFLVIPNALRKRVKAELGVNLLAP